MVDVRGDVLRPPHGTTESRVPRCTRLNLGLGFLMDVAFSSVAKEQTTVKVLFIVVFLYF